MVRVGLELGLGLGLGARLGASLLLIADCRCTICGDRGPFTGSRYTTFHYFHISFYLLHYVYHVHDVVISTDRIPFACDFRISVSFDIRSDARVGRNRILQRYTAAARTVSPTSHHSSTPTSAAATRRGTTATFAGASATRRSATDTLWRRCPNAELPRSCRHRRRGPRSLAPAPTRPSRTTRLSRTTPRLGSTSRGTPNPSTPTRRTSGTQTADRCVRITYSLFQFGSHRLDSHNIHKIKSENLD